MKHYDYQKKLKELWEKAVAKYKAGDKEHSAYYDTQEELFLAEIGMSVQEMFDFAEDFLEWGEPDFETVAMIQDVRRSYFLDEQNAQLKGTTMNPETLPPKDAKARDIEWLPRIIPKAKAKLRGELHPDTMYSCGGDRNFLKTNDIHPAEFLRVVWRYEDDDEKIMDWVEARVKTPVL